MITPFKGGNRITQLYAKRPEYYAQFGLKGHEGLDEIPSDGNRDVFCVEGGEIIRDQDDPIAGKAYGIHVVVWNRENKRVWYYCHLASNNVSLKDKIRRGDKIGVMGGTGNVSGDHLHLNLGLTDDNGVRLNQNNGYLGFVDPKPVVDSLNSDIITPPTDNMDYKAIFDKTGDILPDRALKDDTYFPDLNKLYKDPTNGTVYVTLTADSVNHYMSEYRKYRDIANTPVATPPDAPQSGDNFEAVTEPPVVVEPDLPTYPAVEFDVFDWLWRKISQIWKK